MSLYNLKTAKDGYKIAKFTDDLDYEQDYIVSPDGCDCPAGHRDTCRHRQMLPKFLVQRRVNTPWFYDHDNERWFFYNADAGQMTDRAPRPAWRRI
jgi:hypothetical protein